MIVTFQRWNIVVMHDITCDQPLAETFHGGMVRVWLTIEERLVRASLLPGT